MYLLFMNSNFVLYVRIIIGLVFLFFAPYIYFWSSYKIMSLVGVV